jgi:exodeoxyribonuclease X
MREHRYPLTDVDVVCGHRASFDIGFLRNYLPERFDVIDTLKLARSLWPEAESHKLQTLRYTFGLDAGSAHRAMGDVITTISLMRRIAQEHDTDASGLLMLMNAPLSLDALMPFGKHKNERLRDLPMNYVRWLLDKADIDPDLREALASRV